ncbi:lysozyme M1 precursor [Cutibacterium acnes JCM 18909]|nr:lysozyme M1 precursor [Cutibacterium acnes JCM 18909]
MNCSFNRRQRSWLAAMVSGMTVITFVPAAVAHASETRLPEETSSSSAPSPSDHAMGLRSKKSMSTKLR